MGPGRPANLTHSTAYLTDKPYDVQLGVLRWVRGLISEVIDEAASKLSPAAASIEPDQGTCGLSSGGVQEGDLVLPDAKKREGDGQEVRGEDDAGAHHSSSSGAGEAGGRGGESTHGGSAGVGRKRPRPPSQQGRKSFGLGDVVECFHADDGLWYPATITAIVAAPPGAPPQEQAGATDNDTAPTETGCEKSTEGAPRIEDGVPASPLREGQSPNATLQPPPLLPVSESAPASAVGIVGTDGEEAVPLTSAEEPEDELRSFVVVPVPSKAEAVVVPENRQEARQQEQLLEVTFLGYGNQARVPHDWVREIITPEVLEWCKENGITAASAGAAEEACSSSAIDAAAAAVMDAVDGDRLADARAPVTTVNIGAKGADTGSCEATTVSAQVADDEGARGSRQVGTAEEEEERFLMRCASRSRSPYPHVPNKYWGQRYRYFSRFDDGVTMDEEGWYSVTPEAIARHIAERVCCDVVVDPFVGCGGNAVQFALVAHVVFAIDLDPVKLEHARRNAAIYGVENRIEFILGDAMKVLPTLKADAVFLSPPWGGPGYQDSKTFDLNTMIPPPLSALEMFRAARQVTPNVVFFLPRNVDAFQRGGRGRSAGDRRHGVGFR
ncbi:unnamed protein product [Scytosiphon promiscuus]